MSRSQRKLKRFIILLIDGVSADTLNELIDHGRLPTLKRYIKEGSFHDNVVASFPTVTGPGHIPLFSGFNPASIDFVGHNQFQRQTMRLDNYLLHYKKFSDKFGDRDSLYKNFSDTVSIGEPFRVGATKYRKNLFALADWAKISGPANWYVLRTLRHEYQRGRDLIIGWLHETDALAHLSKDPGRVEKSLIYLDKFLNRFEQELDDQTAIILCSDHGMELTDGKPFSLKNALRKMGHALGENKIFLDGGGFAQIYFKKDGSFSERLDDNYFGNLPQKLSDLAAVDLAMYRIGDGSSMRAMVLSQEGLGQISKKEPDKFCYEVISGNDPLGVSQNDEQQALSSGLDRQQCIKLSGKKNYPDGIFQIYELLKAPSSGDLLLTSAPKFGFNLLTRFGVHGGLNRAQSVTFLLMNKPFIGLDQPTLTTADLPNLILKNRAL